MVISIWHGFASQVCPDIDEHLQCAIDRCQDYCACLDRNPDHDIGEQVAPIGIDPILDSFVSWPSENVEEGPDFNAAARGSA